MKKVRDTDMDISGFLLHSYFIYGFLQVLLAVACVYGAIRICSSPDIPVVLRIFAGIIIFLTFCDLLYNAYENIRKAWREWRDYVNYWKNVDDESDDSFDDEEE